MVAGALLLFAAAAAPVQEPDLGRLERILRRAGDREGYEAGAWEAARESSRLDGPEAMRLRLELYDARLDTYRGVFLRDWFYSGMCSADSLEENRLLAEAAADRGHSPMLRELCLRALRAGTGPVPAAPLLERVFEKDPEHLRVLWQDTLGLLAARGRLEAGREKAGRLETRLRKRLASRAAAPWSGLARQASLEDREAALLLRLLEDPQGDGSGFSLLIRTLDELEDPEREDGILRGIAAGLAEGAPRGAWTASLDLVAGGRHPRAVPLAIAALERAAADPASAGGRFLQDLPAALRQATGQQLGPDPGPWRRWWEERGEDFLARGGHGLQRPAAAGEAPTVARVFGLPVASKRVAVLVDGSGSMGRPGADGRTPAQKAARELEAFLGVGLPADARFNLWIIGPEPRSAFKELAPRSPRSLRTAMDFLQRQDFGGTSALVEAVRAAAADPEVDTLVLITDGGSSAGLHQYAGHMLEALEWEYRLRGVRIHAVAVGEDAPKIRFLESLAALTGGRMVRG